MRMMILTAFLCMVVGLLLVFDIRMNNLIKTLVMMKPVREPTMKQKIKAATNPKRSRGFKKLFEETKIILIATNKESTLMRIVMVAVGLSVAGGFMSMLLGNSLLLPVLMIGFGLVPFWYVKLTATKWKKELNNELETALSVITTSYMRSDSIITAIEENIHYMNPPVSDVFKMFLLQTKLIHSNLKLALASLKPRIDSAVFHEWIDAVMDCQEDKNLKSTLTPIVTKLSDMRVVSAELDYLLYEPVKEFMIMVVLVLGNIPLMYFLNKDWFHTLMFTTFGKIVLAICAVIVFGSMAAVVGLSKPVEYER